MDHGRKGGRDMSVNTSDLAAVVVPSGCSPVDQMAIRREGTGEIVSVVRVQAGSDTRLCVAIAENIRQSLLPGFYVDYPSA